MKKCDANKSIQIKNSDHCVISEYPIDDADINFAIANEKSELEQLIEVKQSDDRLSPSLAYFSKKYSTPGTQVVMLGRTERFLTSTIRLKRAENFLREL